MACGLGQRGQAVCVKQRQPAVAKDNGTPVTHHHLIGTNAASHPVAAMAQSDDVIATGMGVHGGHGDQHSAWIGAHAASITQNNVLTQACLDRVSAFAAEASGLRLLNAGPYDVDTSAPRVVENFLDMAHFGFVHDGWLGSPERAEIDPYLVEETPTGVRATQCRAWQPRSNLHAIAPAQVEYTYEVTGPYSAVLTKVPEPGSTRLADWQEAIGLFICPVGPERCRLWFRMAVADHDSSDEVLRAFQHTIFTQDQPVLQSQRPKRLPLDPRSELHTSVDRLSAAYRRYLKRLNITFGVC